MSNECTSVEKIQSALSFIDPSDREVWVRMGMAVKAEMGDDGLWLWEDWSASAESFNANAAKSVWKSIRAGGKVGIGTLFYEAKQRGWTWNKPERKLSAAEIQSRKEASRRKVEEEEAARAIKHAQAAERAEAIWAGAEPATAHPYLTRKSVESFGLRVGKWEIVDQETGEIRLISNLALLIPIKDRTGKLHSLQAIFPDKALAGRDKDYLAGGAKSGNFFAIGTPNTVDGKRVFVLCEGYATGASIHMATGQCVLCCFDAGNLLSVASSIRERQPDAVIVLAADNDQFNKRKDGTPYNPGVDAARRAAIDIGGKLSIPQFASLDGEPKDFNDLHSREGAAVVSAQINMALTSEAAIEPEPEPEHVQEPESVPPWEDAPSEQPAPEPAPEPMPEPAPEPVKESDEIDEGDPLSRNNYFTVLGFDGDTYYFFVHSKQQIVIRQASNMTEIGLLGIANDINWWEMNFPKGGKSGGIDVKAAFCWLQKIATDRGVYDASRVRGRGAWLDNGRTVFHHGSYLTVDGEKTAIPKIKSAYVYPRRRSFVDPADEAMTAEEGRWLLSVSELVRWRAAGSAALMAGWVMLAPVCGSLKWRPHIWVTGPAGSGKSTLQRDFCVALLNGVSEYVLGDSTEAGIRQKLKSDAIPVLIDELESNNESERKRVECIIGMVRKSSSETQAETARGTPDGDGMTFLVRSMFCLSSINVNLPGKADIDRLSKLTIRPPSADSEAHWAKLSEELYTITSDPNISRRLFTRSLSMLDTIRASIEVFAKVAAVKFGSRRHGDQYGTLLAGCWCLTHDHVPSAEDAQALLDRYDWTEHTEDHNDDDATEALKSVMSAKIRMPGSIGDMTVFEVIQEALEKYRTGKVEKGEAESTLRRHGVIVEEKDKLLLFGTGAPNLKTLLKDASCVTDIRGQMLRLPGATRYGDKTKKFGGFASKCVALPLGLIFDEEVVKPKLATGAAFAVSDEPPI